MPGTVRRERAPQTVESRRATRRRWRREPQPAQRRVRDARTAATRRGRRRRAAQRTLTTRATAAAQRTTVKMMTRTMRMAVVMITSPRASICFGLAADSRGPRTTIAAAMARAGPELDFASAGAHTSAAQTEKPTGADRPRARAAATLTPTLHRSWYRRHRLQLRLQQCQCYHQN